MDPAFTQFGLGGLAIGVGWALVKFILNLISEDRADLRELNAWVRDKAVPALSASEAAMRDLIAVTDRMAGGDPPATTTRPRR